MKVVKKPVALEKNDKQYEMSGRHEYRHPNYCSCSCNK